MNIKICPKCHTENTSYAKFCINCGAQIIMMNESQEDTPPKTIPIIHRRSDFSTTIYYEATEKLDREWIGKNSISHEFSNGKGKIRLKDDVTEIGKDAFYGCSGLTAINIPDSVTKIGDRAFRGCSGLTSINIPDSVTEIGGWAFDGCSGLTSINIPDSVTEIGDCAFSGCSGLTSINIPDSVTEIGVWAFEGCSGLTSIVVAKGNGKYDSRNNCNAIIETATNTLVTGCMNTVIPDSVTEIGDEAFSGCIGLTSINIPDSVTEIGVNAFSGCIGLTSINIPDSVTEIGEWAFDGCRNIMYNGKAKGKPWGALTVNGHVDGYLVYADESKSVLTGCSTLATEAVIPDSVKEIGYGAFSGCSGLTTINIPDSVREIGGWAFSGCCGLITIVVAKGNGKYDSHDNCNAIIETATNTLVTGCMNTVIPDSVTEIGDGAFYYCSGLTAINISKKVKKIGECAFDGCSGLTSVTIPNSVSKIDAFAFDNCKSLKEIIIPKGTRGKFEKLLPEYKDKLVER